MKKRIKELVADFNNTKTSYSIQLPFLRWFFVLIQRIRQTIKSKHYKIAKIRGDYKTYINVRHQSVLMRKLGDVDMKLQENKVVNIKLAIKKIDGVIINPGEVFSFWELVGKPTYKKGYLDGILISHGGVDTGVGGGLCQLSNLLYWMFLHLDVEILERHRHSYDIFPDSGRVLPFASGATIFYNYVDLKMKNTLTYPIQIKLFTNDKYVKGQILSDFTRKDKYHIYEKFHTFVKNNNKYFRYNLINREKIVNGQTIEDKTILENFSPVQYSIDKDKMKKMGYQILEVL